MPGFNDTREQITNDLRAVIAETEALLKAMATESKEQVAGVRPRVETAIAHAKARVERMESALERQARHAVREVDVYAHRNPWQTAGMAAGLGAAVGAIIGVLLAKR
jgi:ElaB/YqjD/DUF883 family membrane-anchored ribosome-binding protein